MSEDSNYPDDIHMYDNTPGSPFYNDNTFECENCQGEMECTDEDEYTCVSCNYSISKNAEEPQEDPQQLDLDFNS